jgi:translocation and assembly module TamA
MRFLFVLRRLAVVLPVLALAALFQAHAQTPGTRAYDVMLEPTGDPALDTALHDSSALIGLKDKAPVDGFSLARRSQDDADRFDIAARSFGYYGNTISITIDGHALSDPGLPALIDRTPAATPVAVRVAVTPGPRFHLGQVTIQGDVPPKAAAALGLKPGQDALAAEVLAARDRLLAELRNESFPLASVTMPPAVLHRERSELDVLFIVDTGRKAAVGPIRFTGLRDVSERFMRQRLTIQPGQPFSTTAIDAARRDLLSLGVFSSVQINPAEQLDAKGDLPLTVIVAERKRHAVDLGASWSTDLGAGLNVAWRDRDLLGGTQQLVLTANLQVGGDATTKPGEQIGAQFIQPDFLRRDQSLEISLNGIRQSLLAYDQRALIEKVAIARKLTSHWSIETGLLGEQEWIVQEGVGRAYTFAGVPVTLKYDSTKNLLDPVNGARAAISMTPVVPFKGGAGFYLISQVSGSTYFDLLHDGRTVVALRGLIGDVSGASTFDLPPDQRLYAGGGGTIRGYRFRSVGPDFADGKPAGGTAMSAGTIELRQRFLESWGMAAFLDAGQAGADGAPFGAQWHAGAGMGLRYYTSIGPIRLDVAVPLNEVRGGDSFDVYIGIGQAF